MERSAGPLILMVLGLMAAYFAYLRIMKRKAKDGGEAQAAGKEAPASQEPAPVRAKPASPTEEGSPRLPALLLVFATMLGLYTAYILFQCTMTALQGLNGGGSSIGAVLVQMIPAALRMATLGLLFRRNKAFRWCYAAAALMALCNMALPIYQGLSSWNPGHGAILLFYAGWLAYLFRSNFVRANFTYKGRGKRGLDIPG